MARSAEFYATLMNYASTSLGVASLDSAGNVPLGQLGNVPSTTGRLTAGTALIQNPCAVNAVVTQAHGLGATPFLVVGELECVNNDNGYVAGEIIVLGPVGWDSSANTGRYDVKKDATNLVLYTVTVMILPAVNATTNAAASLTLANWKFRFIPYKLS